MLFAPQALRCCAAGLAGGAGRNPVRPAGAQVRMGPERVVPLARLRGQVRPVLLAGSAGYVNRALRAAEAHRGALAARGVALVPLVLSDEDPQAKLQALKAQFRCAAGRGHVGPCGCRMPEWRAVQICGCWRARHSRVMRLRHAGVECLQSLQL